MGFKESGFIKLWAEMREGGGGGGTMRATSLNERADNAEMDDADGGGLWPDGRSAASKVRSEARSVGSAQPAGRGWADCHMRISNRAKVVSA